MPSRRLMRRLAVAWGRRTSGRRSHRRPPGEAGRLSESLPDLGEAPPADAPRSPAVRDAVAALERAGEMMVAQVKRTQQLIDSTGDLPELVRTQADQTAELVRSIEEVRQHLIRNGLSDEHLTRRLEPLTARAAETAEQARTLMVRLDHIDSRLGALETSLARRLDELAGRMDRLQSTLRTRRLLILLLVLVVLLAAAGAAALYLPRLLG